MSILSSLLKDVFPRNTAATAPANNGRTAEIIQAEANNCIASRDFDGAYKLHQEFAAFFPQHQNLRPLEAEIHAAHLKHRLPGPGYLDWLKWFQATLKPATYLEIGVETGSSLQYAKAPTRAIGIDPEIEIVHSQQTWVKLYKLPSDDFFKLHDARAAFDGQDIDLAFIDGLHTFDQALKDFINVERYSKSTTVALFHDILPLIPVTATRERESIIWLGDTWKTIALLIKHRPDLKIFTIPTFPSGLTVVANLNASHDKLSRNLNQLIEEGMAMNADDYMGDIEKHLNVSVNDYQDVARRLQG